MKTAFIICSRANSSRLPNKAFIKINGVPLIEHLLKRLSKASLPIIIACPDEQYHLYSYLEDIENVTVMPSVHFTDPLQRMYQAAKMFHVEQIIRVSTDKIFVDLKDIVSAITEFDESGAEYLYGSKFTAGTGFEIIAFDALQRAASKFIDIEFIGHSVKSVVDKSKIVNFNPKHPRNGLRLLVDYEADIKLLNVVLSQLGNNATFAQVSKYLADNTDLKLINKMPELTVYTCAHNAAKWIETCMDSVARQKNFKNYEYIIIDDFSDDKTSELIAKFALKYNNVQWIRNEKNLGLSSSSNIALKRARGKYIIRLDADDYFVSCTALEQMVKVISETEKDAIYPNNFFGTLNTVQKGKEKHHIGGTIFNKDAINHIKFTEGLQNHDSLDIFLRAKDQLNIGYLDKAMFFYFQHGKSMSKTNLKDREATRKALLEKFASDDSYEVDDKIDLREIGVDIEPSH